MSMTMKLKVTGYDAFEDVYSYEVTTGFVTRSTITASALNDLSCSKPYAKPGQFTPEENLLVLIYDEFFKEEPCDLVGHDAYLYNVPAPEDAPTRIKLRPQELQPGCVPLNSNTVKHLKLNGGDE